jgi:polar amino acid transport system substrate-binding protein
MLQTKGSSKVSFLVFLLAGMVILLLSSCVATDSGPRTVHIAPNPTILRVGVSTNAPPLIYSKNNTVTGLEAQFAKKLAQFTGKKVKFVQLRWKDQIPALENNKIDIIMSGMSITQARQYQISFSNPYLRSGQILLVRLGEKAMFTTGIYSLMNSSHIIGTVKDTTGDLFITKTINGAKVKTFTKSADAVKALINKDIDAFVYDAPMICHYAAVNENNKLTPILTLATEEYLAWGIRKEDSKLLSQANAFLEDLKEQQELQRMIRTWIPYM